MAQVAPDPIRRELLDTTAHHHARLYRIARTDGVVIHLTEHSAPIEFEGETYLPTNSIVASATVSRAGLGEQTVEAGGSITSDLITEADLLAGRYRFADVLDVVVDWRYPFLGALDLSRRKIQGTRVEGGEWRAECGGLSELLQRKVGRFVEKSCWKELGDMATCKKDIVPLSDYYAPLSDVPDNRSFRVSDLGSTRPSGWFAYGQAIFRTGANAGTSHLIQAYDSGSQLVTLALYTQFAMQPGDRVDLIVGCDRKGQTCSSKFANFPNFGGLPFLPTTDEQLSPATV